MLDRLTDAAAALAEEFGGLVYAGRGVFEEVAALLRRKVEG